MKNCFKCQQEKPLSDFYRHSQMADGHLGKCKECTKLDVRTHRALKPEQHRAQDKAKHERHKERRLKQMAEYRQRVANQPERRLKKWAATQVGNAVRDGRLNKPFQCPQCGTFDSRIEAHHSDYSKPLDVEWLCAACHKRKHYPVNIWGNAQ